MQKTVEAYTLNPSLVRCVWAAVNTQGDSKTIATARKEIAAAQAKMEKTKVRSMPCRN